MALGPLWTGQQVVEVKMCGCVATLKHELCSCATLLQGNFMFHNFVTIQFNSMNFNSMTLPERSVVIKSVSIEALTVQELAKLYCLKPLLHGP